MASSPAAKAPAGTYAVAVAEQTSGDDGGGGDGETTRSVMARVLRLRRRP